MHHSINGYTHSPPVSLSFFHLPHLCSRPRPFSVSLPAAFILCPSPAEHPDPDASEWRKSVPSYSQSAAAMDPQAWAALSRDESQDPLPKNMEMAYTETGMVYFIE